MKQKNEKITFICFMIASVCFYICSIIELCNDETSKAALHLCLGSSFLCLGTTHINKKA